MSASSDCVLPAKALHADSMVDVQAGGASSARAPHDRGALYTLGLGTFAVWTEGFMIAAILPSIADSLERYPVSLQRILSLPGIGCTRLI
jgi:hypothetical protein